MPRRAHTPPDTPPPATPGAAAIDLVAGDPPVPITVWRTPSGDGQASVPFRLAQRLVSAYSRPGEVVIDVTDDHTLCDATVHGATSLLVTCWPLHAAGARNRTRLRSLLRGGVALLRPGGCLVLIVRAPAQAPAVPQDFGPLVDAARDAGLGYLQHIVAVRADVDGDQFTYYATDAELQALATSGQLPVAHVPVHANLLVFIPRPTGSG